MLLDALYIVILIITFFVSYGITTSVLPSVPNKHIDVLSTCHDPSTGVQYSRHPKFLIYTPEKSAGGLGNTLVYFANAFFLATLTGRELIIGDHSGIGQMCRIINCGYPHVEEMSKVYPQYLSANAIRGARSITGGDLYKLYNGVTDKNGVTKSVHDDWSDLKVVTNSGYQAHVSGWWTQNETLALCIAKVTGCQRLYDNACAERYALQSLVKGPFQRALTEAEEKRIKGAPPSIMHSLVTLPRSYSQRLDVGICIRNQFHFFEKGHDISSPQYKAEVAAFLQSPEKDIMFKSLAQELVVRLEQAQDPRYVLQEEGEPRDLLTDPYLIYIAGDNQEVKTLFVKYLEEMASTVDVLQHSLFIYVEAKQIAHIGTSNFNKNTQNEGMMDVTLDWYSISLCNVVLSWRNGHSGLLSTFVHSAVRVSGNKEASDLEAPIGHGIGSKGYFMVIDKRNRVQWNPFWAYPANKEINPFSIN